MKRSEQNRTEPDTVLIRQITATLFCSQCWEAIPCHYSSVEQIIWWSELILQLFRERDYRLIRIRYNKHRLLPDVEKDVVFNSCLSTK